jgi:hypothetical protein
MAIPMQAIGKVLGRAGGESSNILKALKEMSMGGSAVIPEGANKMDILKKILAANKTGAGALGAGALGVGGAGAYGAHELMEEPDDLESILEDLKKKGGEQYRGLKNTLK